MNAFDEAEIIGRDKTRSLFSKYTLVESPNRYAHWDMSGCTTTIAGDEKAFFIEVKDREVSSTTYDSVYLEWNKYQNLLTVAEGNNGDCFYLSFYLDGVAYVHNLSKLKVTELQLVVKKAPKTTKGNTEYVDKIFIQLPFDAGQRKNYNNK